MRSKVTGFSVISSRCVGVFFFFDLLTIFRCAFVFSIRSLMGDIHRTAGFGFGFGSGSDRGQYYFRRLKYARRAR